MTRQKSTAFLPAKIRGQKVSAKLDPDGVVRHVFTMDDFMEITDKLTNEEIAEIQRQARKASPFCFD
jgi:bisphosphoglycerate-independent phosphoglycerate mutase (AlkP superfamily)